VPVHGTHTLRVKTSSGACLLFIAFGAAECSGGSRSGALPSGAAPSQADAAASSGASPSGDAASSGASNVTDGATRDQASPDAVSVQFAASAPEAASPVGDSSPSGRDFSTDRAKFFGSSRCAQAGVQLCDGFESGVLDKTIWTAEGTPPVIDGVEHARGNGALHITQPGNGLSYIKETKTFPEMHDTYWGRIFVFFKSLPAAPLTYAHWTFVAASGTGVSGEIRVSGQFQGGANFFGVGTDNRVDDAGTGDWTNSDDDPPHAPMAVPLNQWLCIEWLHEGDTNETRFYWDGVEHPSLSTSPTMHGGNSNPFLLPQFTNLWIGWQEYQTTTETFELWIDEIAVDSARIGCVL
jgi:hypothetical protein